MAAYKNCGKAATTTLSAAGAVKPKNPQAEGLLNRITLFQCGATKRLH